MSSEQAGTRRVVCGPRARSALLADVAARPGIEACGLLVGRYANGAWAVDDALPLRNTEDSATYFEFDPEELLRHDLEWGERIVGAYHSHPGGPARPSPVDIGNMHANSASPWVWLILSPKGATPLGAAPHSDWQTTTVAAFRVEAEGELVEFPVVVADERTTDRD